MKDCTKRSLFGQICARGYFSDDESYQFLWKKKAEQPVTTPSIQLLPWE